jgi:sRNA-binding regulator protein Hfq
MSFNSLRPIRERKGITVAQLAGKTSISIRTLQAYEAGERLIQPDDLRKLSRVLFATPTELLQVPDQPPEPVRASSSAVPPERVSPPVAVTAPPVVVSVPPPPAPDVPVPPPPRAYPEPSPRPYAAPPRAFPTREPGLPRPDRPAGPHPAAHPPRERPAPPPAGPVTAGQLEQIRNLARRLGTDDADLARRFDGALEAMDRMAARRAIATLHKELEESGTWQPRVGEGQDQEGAYLAKLRDRHAAIEVCLINGDRLRGTVEDYTPYVIRLRDVASGADVSVRKLAIAYYRTEELVDDAE